MTEQTKHNRSKSDIVRERLEPLVIGERPAAVTVAVAAALLIAALMLAPYAFNSEAIAGTKIYAVIPMSVLLIIAAAGMWKSRYWAVLGFQAYLVLLIITLSIYLIQATVWLAALFAVAMMAASGVLFWFLVKSMARIKMPDRKEGSR